MTYDLILGDRAYSSWSLRGWLLFEAFGLPFKQHMVDFSTQDVGGQMAEFFPAKTVPTMRTPEGAIVGDSIAIAEELATRFPDAGIWPSDPFARATARNMTAEMHSGYGALRGDCPMNLRTSYADFEPSEDVLKDVARIDLLWTYAREKCGADGAWLCGAYSAADAFFAPVAARIAGYGLPVSPVAQAYVDTHLSDPAFRRWRAKGLAKGAVLEWYKKPNTPAPWPYTPALVGKPVETGPSENATCPYSDLPVTHFMELEGRIFGFCNPFCRDKTVTDPAAWPAFMKIYQS